MECVECARPGADVLWLHQFQFQCLQWDVANAIGNMDSMFCGCDSFDRTFVATWPLPDERQVERLFIE
jgi:hypothetical protein